MPIMTPILAKATPIEKRGDQYQVIVQKSFQGFDGPTQCHCVKNLDDPEALKPPGPAQPGRVLSTRSETGTVGSRFRNLLRPLSLKSSVVKAGRSSLPEKNRDRMGWVSREQIWASGLLSR